MTSVVQLPVEAPATQALPKGEMPRGRSNKSTEGGGEGGFSAVLAQVLPERRQAAKTESAVEPKNSRVEGEDTPAGSAEGETATAAATELLAVAVQAEEVPVQPLAELGDELGTETKMMEFSPVAAPAAESIVEGAIQEAGSVEGEGAPTLKLEHPLDAAPESPALETRRAPAWMHEEEQPDERRPVEQAGPVRAELRTAEAVRVENVTAPETAPVLTMRPTHGESAPPQKTGRLPVPKELDAVEQRRIVETRTASKKEPPRPDAPPVIEFQVRKQSWAQEVRQAPQTADWVRALQSGAAEAQPKTALQSKPTEMPPQQALSAQAVTDADPAEKTVPVAAVFGREPEPVRAEDAKRAPLRTAQTDDARRLPTQAVAAAPESQDDVPARRVGTGDTAEARDESVERNAQPNLRALSGRSVVANLAAEPRADTEQSKQVAVKPLSLAPTAPPPTAAEQAAPLSSIPPQTTTRPAEEARPVAAPRPPSEPAIAAKLQQEGGRTTLNVVLHDERLGRVALQLVERGGWIETAIRASDPRTAQTLTNGAAGLFEALQHRGLSLSTGNGAPAWDAQEGQRRDNPQRDEESPRRRFRLRRSGGEFESALARTEV